MFGAHITCACHRVRVVYVIGECFYDVGRVSSFYPLNRLSSHLRVSYHHGM